MGTRRGNNEGSISKKKRKDGRHQAAVTVGYDNEGKPIRKYFYGKTKAEVTAKVTTALHEHQVGTLVNPSRITVSEWIDHWLTIYAKNSVRQSTWESYEHMVNDHIKPHLGSKKLKDLRPLHVQRFYNECLANGRKDGKGGLSPKTVNYIHGVLRQALKQAVKEQLVARNVTELVNPPKKKKHQITPLTIDELNQFLKAASNNRLFPAFLLEWGTGLRRGELLGLKWPDVDLTKGTVSVRRSLIRTKDGLVFSDPKTEGSGRTIPIPAEVATELKSHRVWQTRERLVAGEEYQNEDLVFCSPFGTRMDPRSFTRVFERILKEAGLPRISFHDMRHSHATMLLVLGEHPKVVQERLGHATIAMTLDTYSHLVPGLQEMAAAKLSTVLDLGKSEKPPAQDGR